MNLVSLIPKLFSAQSEQVNGLKSKSDHIIFQPRIIQGPRMTYRIKPRLWNMAEEGSSLFFSQLSSNTIHCCCHIFQPFNCYPSQACALESWQSAFSLSGRTFFFYMVHLLVPGILLHLLKDPEAASFFYDFSDY